MANEFVDLGGLTSFNYASPLSGKWQNLEHAPDVIQEDKSFLNNQTGVLSGSYSRFPDGLDNGRRGGFDVHVYYNPHDADETAFAKALWMRIRLEFPELRIYRFWDRPVGPHTFPMFEVNLHTPQQVGAFFPFLVMNRGNLSILIHPNTGSDDDHSEELRNHTQRATWLGTRLPLNLKIFKRFIDQQKAEKPVNGLPVNGVASGTA